MFGDILVWVLTLFGLIPPTWLAKVWEKLFGRRKDFHEQLAELNDEPTRFGGDICCRDVRAGDDLSDPIEKFFEAGPIVDSLHYNTEADQYFRTGIPPE